MWFKAHNRIEYDIIIYKHSEKSHIEGTYKARFLSESGQILEGFGNTKEDAINILVQKIKSYEALFDDIEELTIRLDNKNQVIEIKERQ